MSGSTQGLIKGFTAGAAISKRRIVKIGAADGKVIQAAAATDALFGISDVLDKATDQTIDVLLDGIAELELAGTVARGAQITSDSVGRGVAAAPATGVNNGVIGVAIQSGVSGDLIPVLIRPFTLQGA